MNNIKEKIFLSLVGKFYSFVSLSFPIINPSISSFLENCQSHRFIRLKDLIINPHTSNYLSIKHCDCWYFAAYQFLRSILKFLWSHSVHTNSALRSKSETIHSILSRSSKNITNKLQIWPFQQFLKVGRLNMVPIS